MTTETEYNIVINHEEQYSIWPAGRKIPGGWELVSIPRDWQEQYQSSHPEADSKAQCLAYIEVVWTDMRPKSIRNQAG